MKSLLPFLWVVFAVAAAAQTANETCSITGSVSDSYGRTLTGAVVELSSNQKLLQRVKAGPGGNYLFDKLSCQLAYSVSASRDEYEPASPVALQPSTPSKLDFTLSPCGLSIPHSTEIALVTIFTLLYFLLVILVRWHNIAVPDRKQLRSEIAMTRTWLALEAAGSPQGQFELEASLNQLEKELEQGSFPTPFLFWSRGDEVALWSRVRDIQRQLVTLWPASQSEKLRARLQIVEQELRQMNRPPAVSLAELVKDTLLLEPPNVERWRELLTVSLGHYYAWREQAFADLTVWQSKSTWQTGVASLIIILSTWANGWAILFLAGAAGGLLSRLARAVKAQDTPTDYGASWTTYFLSPLVGALMGWYGVLLAVALADSQLLNPQLTSSRLPHGACVPLTSIALAFLLGFSERYFDSLVKALEESPLAKQISGGAAQQVVNAPGLTRPAMTTGALASASLHPHDKVLVQGARLGPQAVTKVRIEGDPARDIPEQDLQRTDSSISFDLPPDFKPGEFRLVLTTPAQADLSLPFTYSIAQPEKLEKETVKAGETVAILGKQLASDNDKVKLDLTDSANKSVILEDLKVSDTRITFKAPAAGEYRLRLLPARLGFSRKLIVEN